MPSPVFEQDLQTIRIADFSPGTVTFSRGVNQGGKYYPLYPPSAPLGSASYAVRCYYIPSVGLVPFPTYLPVQTNTVAAGASALTLSLCNMICLDNDLVTSWLATVGIAGSGTASFYIDRMLIVTGTVGSPTQVYSSAASPFGGFVYYPMMDIGEFVSSGTYRRCVITTDIFGAPPSWITVPDWASAADSNSGPLANPQVATPRIFYHASRVGVWQSPSEVSTDGFAAAAGDQLLVSTTPLTPTPYSLSGLYFPEIGSIICSWGSISTGELALIYDTGGAVIIYGDLLAPSSALKLPGVTGAGAVIGKAACTPVGMVYVTDFDGAYTWNGDNTSQKISTQIPDDQLYRNNPNASIVGAHGGFFSSHNFWGQFVMFPNNWVYDTLTEAWWKNEDPLVQNFQVNTCSATTARFFYSSPGLASAQAGSGVSVSIYQWDRTKPALSWTWISNPVPTGSSDGLSSLEKVEVCVSNVDSVPATITITPTVPPGQAAYPSVDPVAFPNNPQPLTLTIPANTNGWRGSVRFGYTDYNIQIRIDAAGTNMAPVLHELSPSFKVNRSAGVQ